MKTTRITSDCIITEDDSQIEVKVWCAECDELIPIILAKRTKYATRVAKQKHLDDLHEGNPEAYRISPDKGMTSGEWKHFQEFLDSNPSLELNKVLKVK